MFIDYLTLMLINAVAGFVIIAAYLYWGLDDPDQPKWAPAFAAPGLVLLITGLNMVLTWPLPGVYNSAFGEMSVLFGSILLAAGISLYKGWNLLPLGVYGLISGAVAAFFGIAFISLKLSMQPLFTGLAFIGAGVAGVFSGPMLFYRKNKTLRYLGILLLLATAGILALTAFGGIWMHMGAFGKYMPVGMRK